MAAISKIIIDHGNGVSIIVSVAITLGGFSQMFLFHCFSLLSDENNVSLQQLMTNIYTVNFQKSSIYFLNRLG